MNSLVAIFMPVLLTSMGSESAAVLAEQSCFAIEFTYVPPYGSYGYLVGQALCDNPSDYSSHAVAVYIWVPPYGWWTKPSWVSPLTPLAPDGTWICDIATGGQDQYATRIIAFLVPRTYDPPLGQGQQCLPAELYAYPYAEAVRHKLIQFANCDWQVKRAHDAVDPGPNLFSDSAGNVSVDGDDALHLKVAQRDGQWHCSELIAERSLGYGRYAFTVRSGLEALNPNVVLGCFTWEDCVPEHHYREIDIEISRWGEPGNSNAQFVVQPWTSLGNMYRFEVDPAGASDGATTHEFIWQPEEIFFRSYYGDFALNPVAEDIIDSWSYTGGDIPPAGAENLRINLWLVNGQPPTDGLDAEVVLSAAIYLPYEPNGVHRFWSPVYSRHFYTMSESEKQKLERDYPHVWTYEGIAYHALPEDRHALLMPIYRFWSGTLNAHFYTLSESEKAKLIDNYPHVWTYEGIAFCGYPEGQQPPGTCPVYRFWSGTLNAHFYTMSPAERDKLITLYSHVWTYEGVAWHAYAG
jgi:hypothetical protein